MGVLLIKNWKQHHTNTGGLKQVFRALKILLEKKINKRRKEAFFETGGKVSAKIAVKCQGIR
jgi:hypothetical protein